MFKASKVVHVVVDGHKLLHQSLHDVKVAPDFGRDVAQVDLDRDLVDIIQKLEGKEPECRILPTLSVYFEDYVLLDQIPVFEHVPKGRISKFLSNLARVARADRRKHTQAVAEFAFGRGTHSTVVLVVGDHQSLGEAASELIVPFDTEVQQSFRFRKVISTQKIPSIMLATYSYHFAICVLPSQMSTLQGLKSQLTWSSKLARSSRATGVELKVLPGSGTPTVGQLKVDFRKWLCLWLSQWDPWESQRRLQGLILLSYC